MLVNASTDGPDTRSIMNGKDIEALEKIANRLARLQHEAEAAGLKRLAKILRSARAEAEQARHKRRH
jgi:uncharacterized ferredoxin-like protein